MQVVPFHGACQNTVVCLAPGLGTVAARIRGVAACAHTMRAPGELRAGAAVRTRQTYPVADRMDIQGRLTRMASVRRNTSDAAMAGQADTLRNGFRAPSFGLSDSIDSLCLERLAALSSELRPVARGTALFRQGDRLNALYEVHAGFFKTAVTDVQGRSQVTGFHLSGDLLGLDGIGSDHHGADAVALEDAMVNVEELRAQTRQVLA